MSMTLNVMLHAMVVSLHLSWRVLFLLRPKNLSCWTNRQWSVPFCSRFVTGAKNVKSVSFIQPPTMRNASRNSPDDPEDDYDYAFCAPYSPTRRQSTVDDEKSIKILLKDIFALKETNVSSWLVENHVKNLCAAYSYLLKSHKDGFLKELASNYAVDHQQVSLAAKRLTAAGLKEGGGTVQICDQRALIKCEEQLKNALTPQYSWLFVHMGRLERGVKFLVDLRTDVLALIMETTVSDTTLVAMQQLNATLREMLSLWFTVGFLNLERVTWRSPCEMLQKISEYEAVHPMRSWTDLKRRVGPYRRCFVYTHSSMPDEPLVVLHTALSDEIASSMKGIVTAASRMSVDYSTVPGLPIASQPEDPVCVKAAIFYSITSTQRGLQGIELGNYLIKRVVKELQAEFPLVNKFSSLSPIPSFHLWLTDRLKSAEKGVPTLDLFTPDELQVLSEHLKTEKTWAELWRLLKNNAWIQDEELVTLLSIPLMRLCVRYLYLEKRRGFALDSVANFHLRNGAVLWRVNWKADLSPRGLGNSCGIMVNYRYFLDKTELYSQTYLEKQVISASDDVRQVAAQAASMMEKCTSKI